MLLSWDEFYDDVFLCYSQEVPENKRRLSIYKGIVISKQNAGIHTTIRVRRIIAGTGVEIIFPM
jgi:large subunit ribosomal protein L19